MIKIKRENPADIKSKGKGNTFANTRLHIEDVDKIMCWMNIRKAVIEEAENE